MKNEEHLRSLNQSYLKISFLRKKKIENGGNWGLGDEERS